MTSFSFQISDCTLSDVSSKHVKLLGELDESNVDYHAETLYELIRVIPRGTHLVLDGAGLTYLNSKAIGYLTDWYNKLGEKDARVFLVALRPGVLDVLELVGLTQIIDVYKTIDEIVL